MRSSFSFKYKAMEPSQKEIKPPNLPTWVMRGSAVCIVSIVLFVYTTSIQSGTMPPSHPWSGIALGLIAVSFFSSSYSGTRPKFAGGIFAVLALVSAILWW
jgi:hypothetical protein